MRVHMLSPAVGNLISTSTDVVPDGMQHVLMTGETADDHRQRPWRQHVLCYDYRHSEMYGLLDVKPFASDGDAVHEARVHRGTWAVNDLL